MKNLWLVLVVWLVGCAGPVAETPTVERGTWVAAADTPTSTSTPTPFSSPTRPTSPVPTLPIPSTETLTPTQPAATITPEYEPICPEPGSVATFTQLQNAEELESALLIYLNEGGSWDDVDSLLIEYEIDHEFVPVDFNGDNVLEMVLNVVVTGADYWQDVAAIVFQCRSGEYISIHQILWGYRINRYSFVDDLNNDGYSEVIIVGAFAGSACALEPTILSWEHDSIVDISPNHLEIALGCSLNDRVIVEDLDGDGTKELIVAGETVGHLDYAPPRGITQTFKLIDGTYSLIETVYAPTKDRVHILDDAQRAFDAGDLLLASQLYAQAAYDETLLGTYSYNMMNPYYAESLGLGEEEYERDYPDEYQRSFALFRLATLQFLLNDSSSIASTLNTLDSTYMEGMPGHEFVILTHQLIDALSEGQDLVLACQDITFYIEETYPNLRAHFYWGGNIAYYSNDTFCPFGTE